MMYSTLSGVGIWALLLYSFLLLCQATTPDVETEELEECADNAHLLVERLRRSYTGYLLKNTLQNFCNGETDVVVQSPLHRFPNVATCRRMSDKLVDAYSLSVKQKSSLEPYFDWCRDVEKVGGKRVPVASRARRGSTGASNPEVAHLAARSPVGRSIARTKGEPSESSEDKFEQVLRNFKAKVTPAAQVAPVATVSQQANSKLPTTMFTHSGAANAEAPNFAAHVQHQQNEQKNIEASRFEESSGEKAVEVAKVEPPAIVHEEQQMVAAGRPVKVSKSKQKQTTAESDVQKEDGGNQDGSPATAREPRETEGDAVEVSQPKAIARVPREPREPEGDAVEVSQPKVDPKPRYDISGPVDGEASLKPMLPVPLKNKEQVPCPSYAVTLSTVGHKSLDRFGEGVHCELDGFGEQFHVENKLPHLAADGTAASIEGPRDGMDKLAAKMSELMGAGVGVGVSHGQAAPSSVEPQQLEDHSETVEATDTDNAVAAPAVEPAATEKKQAQEAPAPEVEAPAHTFESRAKAVVQAVKDKVETPEDTVESKAVMQADEATKPLPKDQEHSFEDSLRKFRNAIRKADTESSDPSGTNRAPATEDHFMSKLQALHASPFLKDHKEEQDQDQFMKKIQVMSAAMNGH